MKDPTQMRPGSDHVLLASLSTHSSSTELPKVRERASSMNWADVDDDDEEDDIPPQSDVILINRDDIIDSSPYS